MKLPTSLCRGFWVCWLLLAIALNASAQLQWRISIKLIADANGNPPPSAFEIISNEVVLANQLFDRYGRGYRFRITEILTLTGVSRWYDVGARNNSNKLALQAAARANPSLYALRSDAENVYIVNSYSGVCSFPGSGDDIVLIGANAYQTLVLHESGHFFNLSHTHEGEDFRNADNSSCTNGCGCARFIAGEADGTTETAPDNECYASLDDIASGAFGALFANLSAGQQARVNNTYRNIMSYHDPANLDVITPDQLDRMADASNGPRFNVCTGRTWFVDQACNSPLPLGDSACGVFFGGPFRHVTDGIGSASVGDIVLIRRGNYNEPQTISKAVTLRATRGNVLIGVP